MSAQEPRDAPPPTLALPRPTTGHRDVLRSPPTVALPRRPGERRPPPFQRRGRRRRAILSTVFGGLGWALLTIYGLVTRFAVAVGSVWGLLYFGLASSWSAGVVGEAVSGALPGTATVTTLRWGPAPWKLALTHPEVRDPEGRPVIEAEAVQLELGLSRTLWSLASWFDDSSENGVTLHIARAQVLRPVVLIAIAPKSGLGLVRAVVPPRASRVPASAGRGFGFELAEGRVLDGEARIEVGAVRLRASEVHGATELHVRPGEGLGFTPGLVTVGAFSLWLDGVSRGAETARLDAHAVAVSGFRWRGERFEWDAVTAGLGRDLEAREGWLRGAAGGMDLAHDDIGWWGAAEVNLSGGLDSLVRRLTRGLVDGVGWAAIAGRGTLKAVDAVWTVGLGAAELGALRLDGVSAVGRFRPRADPLDDDVHAILVDDAVVRLGGGTIHLTGAAWEPGGLLRGGSTRALGAAWVVDGVPLASLGRLAPTIPADVLASGRGVLRSTGTPWGEAALEVDVAEGEVTVGISDETSDLAATAPLWAGRYAVSGLVRHVSGPPRGGDDGLAATSRLVASRVVADRGEDRLRLAGTLDLGRGVLDVEPYLRLGDVAPTARALGLGEARGRLVLKEMRLSGPLDALAATGTLNWTRAAFADTELAQVEGQVRFSDGWLSLEGLRSANGLGELDLSGRIRLLGAGAEGFPFEVARGRLARFAVGRFLPSLGDSARLDLTTSRLSGEVSTLAESLRGELAITLQDALIGGERLERLSASLALDPATIALRELEVSLGARGAAIEGAQWTGAVTLGRASGGLEGTLRVGPTSLAHLGLIRAASPQLSGRLEADLSVRGTASAPEVRGVVSLRDLDLDGVALGSGELELYPHDAGGIAIAARAGGFFPGLRRAEGRLALDGAAPVGLEVELETVGFDPASVLPRLASEQLRTVVSAVARASLRFGRPGIDVTLEAPPGGVRLSSPSRGRSWENRTPLLVTGDASGLSLQPVGIGLRGASSAPVELCGRASPEALDLRVAGVVDLALIPGLDEVLSTGEGALAIVEPSGGAGPDRGTCFYGPRPAIEVHGPPDRVLIAGAVEPRAVTVVPRGFGQALRLRDGGRVELRAGGDGGTLLEIPAGAPLRADLDEGALRLHGQVRLRSSRLSSAELALLATDVVARAPGAFELSASVDGRLVAAGLDGDRPDVRLAGRVDIGEGRFFKSFDVLSQALGGAFDSRSDVYSRSALDGLPWLKTARLDLDVAAPDLLITSALPLARTNLPARLDLSVRGTLERPELYRRVDLTPGGQLTYLVFERTFRITSGAIDFDGPPETPFIDITAQTPVTWLARASTDALDEDEKEVTVTLRVLGRVPDLKIELSADDGTLDQADIQALLLTGKPRGDLDRAEESRVVSADLATVLNGVLAAPFLRTASVGVGQKGALEYRVGTCLAPNLCFDTTTIAADTETTLRARFSLALGDQLVCEGTLRRSDANTTTNQQTYQARCRYRVPLR